MKWSHVALNCRDMAATERFYTQHLGFRRARVIDLDGGAQILFLKLGDAYLELFAAEPTGGDAADSAGAPGLEVSPDGPHAPGVARHLAFQVDDIDQVLAGLGDEARVTLGPLGFDAFIPGWRTVWVTDPDGVTVEISQGYTDQDNPPPAAGR